MRIHGIHLQGIRAPRGERRLAFDPGFNLVLCRDAAEAGALVSLLETLLCLDGGLEELRERVDPDAESSRVDLSLALARERYRLIADLAGPRVALVRHDPGVDRYVRVSTDPGEIRARLERSGLPAADVQRALQVCGRALPLEVEAPESTSTDSVTLPVERDGGRELPAAAERAPQRSGSPALAFDHEELNRLRAETRAQILRIARDRVARIEGELKEIEVELERRAALADALDDLDARIPRVRVLEAERAREVAALEASRRGMLDERRRLRAVPDAQRTGMGLGVALGAAGAAGGMLVDPWLYALSLAGVGVATAGLVFTRGARRAVARLDERLAALRVRQSAVERRLETEAAPLQRLERALGIEGLDALEREAAEHRVRTGRVGALTAELDLARTEFPAVAEAELRELESLLARPAPEPPRAPEAPAAEAAGAAEARPPAIAPPAGSTARSAAPSAAGVAAPSTGQLPSRTTALAAAEGGRGAPAPPAPRVLPEITPDDLLRAAERASRVSFEDTCMRLRPTLPIYLRALTDGAYAKSGHVEGSGWSFRRRDWSRARPHRELPEADRPRVELALRLALLEVLAPELRVPLLVGPDLEPEDPTRRRAVVRALQRLGSAVQVILCAGEPDWRGVAEERHSRV